MQLSNKNVREALKYIGFLVVGFVAAFAIGFGAEFIAPSRFKGYQIGSSLFLVFIYTASTSLVKQLFPNRRSIFYLVICLPVSLILGSLVWFLIIKS